MPAGRHSPAVVRPPAPACQLAAAGHQHCLHMRQQAPPCWRHASAEGHGIRQAGSPAWDPAVHGASVQGPRGTCCRVCPRTHLPTPLAARGRTRGHRASPTPPPCGPAPPRAPLQRVGQARDRGAAASVQAVPTPAAGGTARTTARSAGSPRACVACAACVTAAACTGRRGPASGGGRTRSAVVDGVGPAARQDDRAWQERVHKCWVLIQQGGILWCKVSWQAAQQVLQQGRGGRWGSNKLSAATCAAAGLQPERLDEELQQQCTAAVCHHHAIRSRGLVPDQADEGRPQPDRKLAPRVPHLRRRAQRVDSQAGGQRRPDESVRDVAQLFRPQGCLQVGLISEEGGGGNVRQPSGSDRRRAGLRMAGVRYLAQWVPACRCEAPSTWLALGRGCASVTWEAPTCTSGSQLISGAYVRSGCCCGCCGCCVCCVAPCSSCASSSCLASAAMAAPGACVAEIAQSAAVAVHSSGGQPTCALACVALSAPSGPAPPSPVPYEPAGFLSGRAGALCVRRTAALSVGPTVACKHVRIYRNICMSKQA